MNEQSRAHKLLQRLGGRVVLDYPSMRTPSVLDEQKRKDEAKQGRMDVQDAHEREMRHLAKVGGGIDRIKYPAGEFDKKFLKGGQ